MIQFLIIWIGTVLTSYTMAHKINKKMIKDDAELGVYLATPCEDEPFDILSMGISSISFLIPIYNILIMLGLKSMYTIDPNEYYRNKVNQYFVRFNKEELNLFEQRPKFKTIKRINQQRIVQKIQSNPNKYIILPSEITKKESTVIFEIIDDNTLAIGVKLISIEGDARRLSIEEKMDLYESLVESINSDPDMVKTLAILLNEFETFISQEEILIYSYNEENGETSKIYYLPSNYQIIKLEGPISLVEDIENKSYEEVMQIAEKRHRKYLPPKNNPSVEEVISENYHPKKKTRKPKK